MSRTLEVAVQVDDPGAFTMPWSAMQHFRRSSNTPMTEASCAENNSGYFGYEVDPIPQAVKPDF
jgi:hypothetical protein